MTEPADGKQPAPAILLPARPYALWKRAATAMLATFLCSFSFGACMVGPLAGEQLSRWSGDPMLGFAAGVGTSCGLPMLFILTLVIVVHDATQHFRAARVQEGGVAFLHSPIDGGRVVRWSDVHSFRTVSNGLVLRLKGRRRFWTRWLGPKLVCEGETLHQIVVLMESKGIFADGA